MPKRHSSFYAAALLTLSVTCVHAADWSAAIGTGRAADSRAEPVNMKGLGRASAGPHWSATIGTGHAAQREPRLLPNRRPGPAAAHWTSLVGTGHAMP